MKKKLTRYIVPVAMIIVFIAVLVWFLIGLRSAGDATRSGKLESVKRSVENGITLCYSIEGVYPESLQYLTENYGLAYDSESYIIHYDCFADNVRPTVTVMEKRA